MKLLKLVPDNTNIDFMRWRNVGLILSLLLTVASLLLVGFKCLNLGVDFLGGQMIRVTFSQPVDVGQLRDRVGGLNLGDASIQETGGPRNDWFPEGQVGVDYEYRLTDRTRFTLTGDYYADLEDFDHYRVRVRAAFDILIDPDLNMWLRLGAFNRYDNWAFGSKRNDLDYFMTLLFRF